MGLRHGRKVVRMNTIWGQVRELPEAIFVYVKAAVEQARLTDAAKPIV